MMRDKPVASPTCGLECDLFLIKGAIVTLQKGKPALVRVFEIDLQQEQNSLPNVKPLYNKDQKSIFSSIQKNLIVTAMAASEVLIRNLEVPLIKERDIDAVLEFQVEPLLPYNIEDAIIDRMVVAKTREKTHLSIVAARSDHLSQHLEHWRTLSIEPEVVSCIPQALASFSQLFSTSENVHIILHLGMLETACLLVKQGKLLASQASRKGLINLVEALASDAHITTIEARQQMSSLSFSSVTENSFPQLFQSLQNLRQEVAKFLFALVKQVEGSEVKEIFVTGEGAAADHLPETLCENFGKILIFPKENPQFSLSSNALQRYAAVIGAALTTLPKSNNQINFRQKDFVYPYPWKRIKKNMAVYLGLCLALAATLFFFGNVILAKQEDALKKEYLSLLTAMHKPFDEFEAQFHQNDEKPVVERRFPIEALTPQDIKKRLLALEKEAQKIPDTFPLLPQTPRVSDVLAWLSTHPQIVGSKQEKAAEKPRIALEAFHYKMVKRPEQNKEKERYQVKIDLEFSAPIPRYAREFHDSLLRPNDFVDSTEEVKWHAEREKYRASFFLKDKTVYPTRKKR